MKHQDEFRKGAVARPLIARLKEASTRPVRLMEICGTHTMAVFSPRIAGGVSGYGQSGFRARVPGMCHGH